jgi:hypothetical protein
MPGGLLHLLQLCWGAPSVHAGWHWKGLGGQTQQASSSQGLWLEYSVFLPQLMLRSVLFEQGWKQVPQVLASWNRASGTDCCSHMGMSRVLTLLELT